MTFAYFEAEAGAAPVHAHDHPQEEVWSILSVELEVHD
jgi:hypothetical protein